MIHFMKVMGKLRINFSNHSKNSCCCTIKDFVDYDGYVAVNDPIANYTGYLKVKDGVCTIEKIISIIAMESQPVQLDLL